jgi:hypothetical protein
MMTRHLLASTSIAALLSLCACTTLPMATVADLPAQTFSDPADGVLLLSTRAAGPCKFAASWLHVYDLKTRQLVDGAPMIPVDLNEQSDFGDHYGAISAVRLRPGHYYLLASATNPYMVTRYAAAFGFEIRPGETIYGGELATDADCRNAGRFSVTNEYARDTRRAAELNPAVGRRPVVVRPLRVLGSLPVG